MQQSDPFFKVQIREKSGMVTARDIRECKRRHNIKRTEAQIRTKINNIMKGKEKKHFVSWTGHVIVCKYFEAINTLVGHIVIEIGFEIFT